MPPKNSLHGGMSLLELTVVMTVFMGILALTMICGATLKADPDREEFRGQNPEPKRILPTQMASVPATSSWS